MTTRRKIVFALGLSAVTAPLAALLAAGSLHYNYTLLGPRSVEEFVAVQLAVAVLAAALVLRA